MNLINDPFQLFNTHIKCIYLIGVQIHIFTVLHQMFVLLQQKNS